MHGLQAKADERGGFEAICPVGRACRGSCAELSPEMPIEGKRYRIKEPARVSIDTGVFLSDRTLA